MRLLWLALPAAASVELLAVTNKITQDIAVIPFLWVLPLGLYLLSFILCFEHQRWYKRAVWIPLFIAGIIGVIYARADEMNILDVRLLIGLYVFMLFTCCMVCHGEVYRLRPPARHLTEYYLLLSAGGALGGFFVAVIAPLIFNVYIELWLGILAAALFLLIAEDVGEKPSQHKSRRKLLIAGLVLVGAAGIALMGRRSLDNQRALENRRNFFGTLTVWEESWDDPQQHKLLLQHGTTFHGLQFQSPQKRDIPTAYYTRDSGVGLVMQNFKNVQSRRIGIVGLGVGTIAIYGQPNDAIRFYEINEDVELLARQYFTYLEDSAATAEVALGDARLTMENETPQDYDVLVLDAFSSDAVPVHLLTKEAMDVYLKHLTSDGVLAFHISTNHLDLQSVVWRLAEEFGLHAAWIEGFENPETGALSSDWILVSREKAFLDSEIIKKASTPPTDRRKDVMLWTDDHINLLQILKKKP
ncbi:MAG: fused MFS/spermidine synthase [Planctomycetaceae bacterium]|nr:fused MFS/spermidine synthase [Planctomycetaceae bacterium]